MHPDCPDYDLCPKCEALPIAVHPAHHPLLKVRTPETLIPVVYRTKQDVAPVAASIPEPEARAVTPKPVAVAVEDNAERPETPKPVASPIATRDDDARSPFADPPMIDPIIGVHSLASSFEASINAHRIGLRTPSPVQSPAAEASANPFNFTVEKQDAPAPSFVNDLMAQTQFTGLPTPMTQTHSPLPVIGALNALYIGGQHKDAAPTVEEPEMALAELVSQNHSLISLAESVSDTPTEVRVEASIFHVPPPPPLAPFHATFVADVTVTDGQIFPPGAEFVKYWRMINDSSRDWPEGTSCVYVGGANLLIDPTSDVVKVGRVKAGEEVEVSTGELKAPEEPGHYVSYWRMRDEDGNLFGNSIWVE
jgi:next to BRCA1 gene 1 protein